MKTHRLKVLLAMSAAIAIMDASSGAFADDAAQPTNTTDVAPAAPRHRWIGMGFDVGAPDGFALGVVVRPQVDWLRLELAATENVLAPGMRLGATFDPIQFPIAPSFTMEGGFAGMGKLPGKDKGVPSIGYDYVNFHLGVELGNRDRWRFFIHAGPSYLHVATGNFTGGTSVGSITLGNPTANVWFTPTAKLGFVLYF